LGLATLCDASAVWATDYSVATTGSDSATGSASDPWATIQHAVDTMQPGDSVTVANGSYIGFWMKNRQGDAQHRFTIRAQNPLGVTITAPSPTGNDPNDNVQLVSVSYATIDGFEVTGAPRAGISIRTFGDDTGADTTGNIVQNCRSHDNGAGITTGRHDGIFTGFALNVTIQNNEVDHNAEHGIYVSNSADNPIISGNKSHDNLANGLQINADGSVGGDGVISNWLMSDNIVYGNSGASAINLDGATFGILRNNLVYGNAEGGVALYMGDANEASHDNVVVGNTVYDPAGTRFAVQIDDGADNNILFDNFFWSAASGMEIGSVTGFSHDYNIVSSYSGGTASAHESSADSTQLFADLAAGDYQPGPALIGKGIGTYAGAVAPAVDLAGSARPQSGICDVGCYEHGSPASTPASPDGGTATGSNTTSPGPGASGGSSATASTGSAPAAGAGSAPAPGAGSAPAAGAGSAGPGRVGAGPGASTGPDASAALAGIPGAAGTSPNAGAAPSSTAAASAADSGAAAAFVNDDGGPTTTAIWAASSPGGGGCNSSSGATGGGGTALLSLALFGVSRRRRRR
jgi:MYXO-CTERM domain-containing protein